MTFGTTKNSSFLFGEFSKILSLIFPSLISSFLDLKGSFNIDESGLTLSVFNSLSCYINLKIEDRSLAKPSIFFSSTEILASLLTCLILSLSIDICELC